MILGITASQNVTCMYNKSLFFSEACIVLSIDQQAVTST